MQLEFQSTLTKLTISNAVLHTASIFYELPGLEHLYLKQCEIDLSLLHNLEINVIKLYPKISDDEAVKFKCKRLIN